MVQDLLEANFNRSAFYFSESFIFSLFWWLFVPLLYAQYRFVETKNSRNLLAMIPLVALPVLFHLVAFPAVVWLVSSVLYFHTFRFQQTFQYGLSEYLLQLFLFYSIPVLALQYFKAKAQSRLTPNEESPMNGTNQQTTLVVSEGGKRTRIAFADVHFITANPPYINIHHKQKKYLHNETLKSISERIGSNEFVRIHKSTIINMKEVQSYKSRLNGDDDVLMKNGTQLRLSRIYAPNFKGRFHQGSS
jgi:hypothetical protein